MKLPLRGILQVPNPRMATISSDMLRRMKRVKELATDSDEAPDELAKLSNSSRAIANGELAQVKSPPDNWVKHRHSKQLKMIVYSELAILGIEDVDMMRRLWRAASTYGYYGITEIAQQRRNVSDLESMMDNKVPLLTPCDVTDLCRIAQALEADSKMQVELSSKFAKSKPTRNVDGIAALKKYHLDILATELKPDQAMIDELGRRQEAKNCPLPMYSLKASPWTPQNRHWHGVQRNKTSSSEFSEAMQKTGNDDDSATLSKAVDNAAYIMLTEETKKLETATMSTSRLIAASSRLLNTAVALGAFDSCPSYMSPMVVTQMYMGVLINIATLWGNGAAIIYDEDLREEMSMRSGLEFKSEDTDRFIRTDEELLNRILTLEAVRGKINQSTPLTGTNNQRKNREPRKASPNQPKGGDTRRRKGRGKSRGRKGRSRSRKRNNEDQSSFVPPKNPYKPPYGGQDTKTS